MVLLNLYLINDVKDTVVFLGLKVFKSDIFSCSYVQIQIQNKKIDIQIWFDKAF